MIYQFSLAVILSLFVNLTYSQQKSRPKVDPVSFLTTEQNVPVEISIVSTTTYLNPFKDIEVDALITAPDKTVKLVPAFWNGNNTWKIRFASPDTGKYSWTIRCSNKRDRSLNSRKGMISITPYLGTSMLYKKGPLQISDDQRHFQFADTTAFFWLGDTWWKGLSKRIDFEGFKQLAADRKEKGFNVIQIICGPYPDEPPFDPRWANEGGMPYGNNYDQPNPAYFDTADTRIKLLIQEGLMPAIVGGWGWHMEQVGAENFVRHWRYLIARYGAYPVTWIVGGEAGGDDWTNVARKLRSMDPYRRLVTMHSYPGSGRMYVTDESVLDFDMLQTGHGGFFGANSPYGAWAATASNTVSKIMAAYSKTPTMPVLIGEVTYEGHMRTNGAEVQRQQFWSSILAGAAGHTYGAGGIWQMNSDTERGAEYEFTPWHEAMKLPGSAQLGIGRSLLEEYEWWKFQPHPDWVEPHSTSMYEPHEKWYDDSTRFAERGNRWDLPYAAGIAENVRIVFIPGHYYDWSAPTIKQLEPGIAYHTFLVDPSNGKRYELGVVINEKQSDERTTLITKELNRLLASPPLPLGLGEASGIKPLHLVLNENPRIFSASTIPAISWVTEGEYKPARLPAPQDWLLIMERILGSSNVDQR